jgi:oxalate decarboxylase
LSEPVFRLGATAPQVSTRYGARTHVRRDNFPILERLSLAQVEVGGFREPHWHANAHELGYCLDGELLVTVFGDYNQHASFTISPGQMFFVPSGALHALENVHRQGRWTTAHLKAPPTPASTASRSGYRAVVAFTPGFAGKG